MFYFFPFSIMGVRKYTDKSVLEEISTLIDDLNSYSESTDRVLRFSGSFSKTICSETLQASIYNFPQFGIMHQVTLQLTIFQPALLLLRV